MKIEINLDSLEQKAIDAFVEYNRTDDRVSLGEAYAYTKLLASILGLNMHTLIEKLSDRAKEK